MTTSSRQRPWIRATLIRTLCVLLLFQGYPVWALEQLDVRAEPHVPPFAERALSWLDEVGRADGSRARPWERVLSAGRPLAERWTSTVRAAGRDAGLLLWAMAGGGGAMAIPGDVPSGPPEPPGFAKEASSRLPAETFLADPDRALKAALDEIPLVPGWNLLSVPEEPSDTSPASVLETIGGGYERIYAYDACDTTDPWKVYDPNDSAASDLTALDHRMGFWAEATLPVDLLSDGTLPSTTTFELCEGWNLIGFPAGQARPVRNALSSIEGKYIRVFGYDAADPQDPWEFFDVAVPSWANDLEMMEPGRGYWVLVTEPATVTFANDGPAPSVSLTVPEDLAVITAPTDVLGTVESALLKGWVLSYRAVGEGEWIEIASGVVPVASGQLGVFDPTLLLNGLYEIQLTASDYQGRTVVGEPIAVSVEGNMKIGNFTLSFIDLAIPLSGLDVEVVRTYDSRDKAQRDFGVGWRLDIRQGSYHNNREPGDGWQITSGFLPCQNVQETKSHLTTIRLSDREIYLFRLRLTRPAATLGGCFAEANFDFVDGPLPGTTLQVLGNNEVIYQNESDFVIDVDTLESFEPQGVRLTTPDGRLFDLDLDVGVTRLEDRNGNVLDIGPGGIEHSSGRGITFVRDGEGRIERLVDPQGAGIDYVYDAAGDLSAVSDRAAATTRYTYDLDHVLLEVEDPLGNRAVRNEYDDDGRLTRTIDAFGTAIEFVHDLDARREVQINRLGQTRIFEYDERGNVVRETDESGGVTTRTFDGSGNVLTETDPLGRSVTRAYDGASNLASLRDPLGHEIAYTYSPRLQPLTFIDARGQVTVNVYDGSGNLLSTTDPLGNVTSYAYDSAGNLLSMTDPSGGMLHYEYDGFGNLARLVEPTEAEATFTYDSLGNPLTESRVRTTAAGVETVTASFTYEASRLSAVTDPDGTTTTTTYDGNGNVTARTDKLGGTTSFAYDAQGRRVATTFPNGSVESQTYDAEGRIASHTDRAGRTTLFAYDALGRLLTTTFPDGTVTSSVYDVAGQKIAALGELGETTSFAYDASGRMTERTDVLGQTVRFAYDANGNQTAVTGPRGFTTAFKYDQANRLARRIFADGTKNVLTYDKQGRKVSEQDAAGQVSSVRYDASGRPVEVTDAAGLKTRFTYDEFGNQTSQIDAAGRATTFEYNSLGRLTRRTLPSGESESMTYDPAGNLRGWTDFSGATTSFYYDAASRLVEKRFPDGTTTSLTYTATGRRQSVTDGFGTTSYTYDVRDRLTKLVRPDGRRLVYEYDAAGRRTRLEAVLGTTTLATSYAYDALGRLVEVMDSQGRSYVHGYDLNGNRASLTYPNGAVTSYGYDALDRLSTLATTNGAGEVIQSYAYTLAPAGQRTRVDEDGGVTRLYEYDALYRLTRETVSEAGVTALEAVFTWGPTGNRLSATTTDAGGTVTGSFTYDVRDRLLTGGGASYSWDANGNLTAIGGTALTWDAEDRLSSVSLGDSTLVEHEYDIDGNRVRTRVTPSGGGAATVTDFLVDPAGLDGLSQVVTESVASAVTAYYVRGLDLLAVIRGATPRYFHADGLGSIRRLTDEAGTVTDRYTYSAFGEIVEHVGSDPNPYLFTGAARDSATGYYFLRARWMDPGNARFLSSDPFPGNGFDPASLHKYTYAQNDPVNRTDPTGLFNISFSGVMAALAIASFLGNSAMALINVFRSFRVTTPEEAAQLRFAAAMNTLGAFLAFFGGGLGGAAGGGFAVAGAGTSTVIGQAVVIRADWIIGSVAIPAATHYLMSSSSDGGGGGGGSGGGAGGKGRIDVKDPHVNVPKHNLNRLAPTWSEQRKMLIDAVRQISSRVRPAGIKPNGAFFESTVEIQSASGSRWLTTIRWFEYADGSKIINTAFVP